MSFEILDDIDQSVFMTHNMTPGLLDGMNPPRNEMAVVQPVATVQMPLQVEDMVIEPDETHHEIENMGIEVVTIGRPAAEENEPVIGSTLSTPVQEFDYPPEYNVVWIEEKILLRNAS